MHKQIKVEHTFQAYIANCFSFCHRHTHTHILYKVAMQFIFTPMTRIRLKNDVSPNFLHYSATKSSTRPHVYSDVLLSKKSLYDGMRKCNNARMLGCF